MHLSRSEPSGYFLATNGGVGMNFAHRCAHGSPAFSLHLYDERDFPPKDIAILLYSCLAPELFGVALAHMELAGGSEAGAEFVKEMFAARDRAREALLAHLAERRDPDAPCCEAGARSQGREHTCGRSAGSPS
ncbi:hypothetical protein [Streptomyces reticuli]|uniref:hypothetical protein n=1 Tax=Streptomyces reticuli TaxID=1926 RepID=UPI00073DFF5A|nr:hypothetical protein [Streptomyces sp. SID7810]CUW29660.1 hypothetical protein TUE45_04369 [Streptomyces reticuli]